MSRTLRLASQDPRLLEVLRQGGSERLEFHFESQGKAWYFAHILNRIRVAMREANHVFLPFAERAIIRRPSQHSAGWLIVVEPSGMEFDSILKNITLTEDLPELETEGSRGLTVSQAHSILDELYPNTGPKAPKDQAND